MIKRFSRLGKTDSMRSLARNAEPARGFGSAQAKPKTHGPVAEMPKFDFEKINHANPSFPPTGGECADMLYALRYKRIEMEHEADKLKKLEGKLKSHIIDTTPKTTSGV